MDVEELAQRVAALEAEIARHRTETGYGSHMGPHADHHADQPLAVDRMILPTSGSGIDASYVTINSESGLNYERRLVAGTGVQVTDGGANSVVTVSHAADATAIPNAHHAAVTLGAGSAPELALAGQQLTLTGVLTPTEHTAIGNGTPHHAAVTLSTAAEGLLGLTAQELGLDNQASNTVFAGPTSGGTAAPAFRALVDNDIPTTIIGNHIAGDPHGQYVLETTLTTKGDLLTRDTNAVTRLAVGTADQVLTADSAQSVGVKWAAPKWVSYLVFGTESQTYAI